MSDTPHPGAGRAILEQLARIEAKIDAIAARQGTNGVVTAGVAPDSDLDSQWGDEEIRKDPPRDWSGDSYKGRRMSECPPEYLDALAGYFDWKAGKEAEDAATLTDADEAAKKSKYSGYSRKSAARARGWAARLRSGWKPAVPAGDASTDGWG